MRTRNADGHVIAPDQAISAKEALYAYAMGGAIASGDTGNRGSVEPGTWADLTVLTGNPLDGDAGGLADLGVAMTIRGGRIVDEA